MIVAFRGQLSGPGRRMLNDRLGAALGQPVIVENRPGAGGNLGTHLVAKAAPDGYTIGLSIGGPLAVNKVLYPKLEFDPFTDLAPITLVAASPNVLVVDPGLGVGSVKEFVALARAQPGRLNYGSVGNGSASHLTMELLKTRAGIDIVHIPYPGSPQVNAAIAGGQIAAGFVVPATAMPLVQGGRMKALAVTSSVRSAVLPELPTVAEAGFPGFQSTAWIGMVAPPRPRGDHRTRVGGTGAHHPLGGRAQPHAGNLFPGDRHDSGRTRQPDARGSRTLGRRDQANRRQGRLTCVSPCWAAGTAATPPPPTSPSRDTR